MNTHFPEKKRKAVEEKMKTVTKKNQEMGIGFQKRKSKQQNKPV